MQQNYHQFFKKFNYLIKLNAINQVFNQSNYLKNPNNKQNNMLLKLVSYRSKNLSTKIKRTSKHVQSLLPRNVTDHKKCIIQSKK